jgi:hypothetical protein
METGLAPLQLDDIDPSSASVRRYLREKGLVKPNEFLIPAVAMKDLTMS